MRGVGVDTMTAIGKALQVLNPAAEIADKETVHALDAAADAAIQWQHSTAGIKQGGVAGFSSRIAGYIVQGSGVHWMFNRAKQQAKAVMAQLLGGELDKSFDELHSGVQNTLLDFGINKEDWELLRGVDMSIHAPNLEDGKHYLVPGLAGTVDDEAVKALLQKKGAINEKTPPEKIGDIIQDYKDTLAGNLRGVYTNAAERAVVTPGARARAVMGLYKAERGTPLGEIIAATGQFKMWTTASLIQTWEQHIFDKTFKQAAWSLGPILAIGAASGITSNTLKAIIYGQPMPDPLDWRSWISGLARSGSGGLPADMLASAITSTGDSKSAIGDITGSILGPVYGGAFKRFEDVHDIMKGVSKIGTPDENPDDHYVAKALDRFAENNLPAGNLPYTKAVLNYLVLYHTHEAANPGWWERHNQKLIEEGRQTLGGYSPGGEIPYNPITALTVDRPWNPVGHKP